MQNVRYVCDCRSTMCSKCVVLLVPVNDQLFVYCWTFCGDYYIGFVLYLLYCTILYLILYYLLYIRVLGDSHT